MKMRTFNVNGTIALSHKVFLSPYLSILVDCIGSNILTLESENLGYLWDEFGNIILKTDFPNEDVLDYIEFCNTGLIHVNFNPQLFIFMGHDIHESYITHKEYGKIRMMQWWSQMTGNVFNDVNSYISNNEREYYNNLFDECVSVKSKEGCNTYLHLNKDVHVITKEDMHSIMLYKPEGMTFLFGRNIKPSQHITKYDILNSMIKLDVRDGILNHKIKIVDM